MPVFLTVIGTWVGTHSVTLESIKMFFYKWLRNFSISFFIELCITRPIARFIILKLHLAKDKIETANV